MIHWIPYAFVRIVLFFIAGILLGIYRPDFFSEPIAQAIFIGLILLYGLLFFTKRIKLSAQIDPGFVGLLAIFFSGYVHLLGSTDSRRDNHFIHVQEPITYYQCVINNAASVKEKTWKVEAKIISVKTDVWESSEGKVLLYFSKKDFNKVFRYGDVLLVRGSPQKVEPPANPGQFDYKRYLSFQKIYHQHFIRSDGVSFLKNDPPSQFIFYAIQTRQWAEGVLEKHIHNERELATASALILGVTDGLDNELLAAYAATGAMHVLSVSGLHVSIIYMIILWLLGSLNKSHKGKWILAVISVFILWGYAFVTGLSPSVLRAVTMFTFVALSRPWNRRINIYNVLALSACCLLLYEPYLIMSVGFQLSYLAVLGIVYLHPALYRLWEPKSWMWDQIWKITSVSIAAQLATFSLGLLYFHQFPNYFLLSNLLVIPGSFLVLVLGLLLLASSVVSAVSSVVGYVLHFFIWLMNGVVFIVESFPFSLIENIYITPFQCWLIIAMSVSFILLVQYKRFSFLIVASCLVVVYTVSQWYHFQSEVSLKRIVVYKVPGHSAMDFISNGQADFLSDSGLVTDFSKQRFHLQPNRIQCGVGRIFDDLQYPVKTLLGGRMMVWNKLIVLQVTDRNFVFPKKIKVDYLIISDNAIQNLKFVLSHVEAKKIVIDSSNTFYHADSMLKQAAILHTDVYSVWHQGAYYQIIEG